MGEYLLTVFTAFLLVSNCYSERFGFGGGLRLGQKGIKTGSGIGDSIFNQEEGEKNTSEDPQKVASETKIKAYGEVSKTKQDVGGGGTETQNTDQSVEENKEIEGEVSGGVSVQKNGPPKRGGGKFQFPCGTF